jgi:hypothetical protein
MVNQIQRWALIVCAMSQHFSIRSQQVCVKHIMDAPLCGKLEAIIDQGHHLDNPEWSMAFWSQFCHQLIGLQMAPFKPHLIAHQVFGCISMFDPRLLCMFHKFCASFLASLNCTRHVTTCDIGDFLSVQSVRGWYPIRMWNGDSPVALFGQLLCANSMMGRSCAQLSCCSFTQKQRYCSNH